MYEFLASIIKYLFVTAIYFFMFSIIRLIYLDIRHSRMGTIVDDKPYIKLLNRRGELPFRVEETYSVDHEVTLGRGADAKITIPDPFLSAIHIQFLQEEDGGWAVLDNNSTNGTIINGEKIEKEPCAVKTGDLIRIGQLNFIFVEPVNEED